MKAARSNHRRPEASFRGQLLRKDWSYRAFLQSPNLGSYTGRRHSFSPAEHGWEYSETQGHSARLLQWYKTDFLESENVYDFIFGTLPYEDFEKENISG